MIGVGNMYRALVIVSIYKIVVISSVAFGLCLVVDKCLKTRNKIITLSLAVLKQKYQC